MSESLRCEPDHMALLAGTFRLVGRQAGAVAGAVAEAAVSSGLPAPLIGRLRDVEERLQRAASVVDARASLAASFHLNPLLALHLDDRVAGGEVLVALPITLDALGEQRVAAAIALLRAPRATWAQRSEALEELGGPELDRVVAGLTDAELRGLLARMRRRPTRGGWAEVDRRRFYERVGERVSRDTWQRLGRASTEIEPDIVALTRRWPPTTAEGRRARWVLTPFDGPISTVGDADRTAVAPDDVRQGRLGDCFLIASLQALAASHPDALAAMLHRNGNGTVTVSVPGLGVAVVDPSFLTEVSTPRRPSLARPAETPEPSDAPDLWALLVEKAFAVLRGGYRAIDNGGRPGTTMRLLAGGTTERLASDQLTIDDLADRFDRGEAMVVSTVRDGDRPPPVADGRIVTRHAYSVAAVDRVAGTVTLQNPWHVGGVDQRVLTLDELRSVTHALDANRVPGARGETAVGR